MSRPRALRVPLASTALGLALFDLLSAGSSVARRGWLSATKRYVNARARPPAYGVFQPGFSPSGLVAIALGALGAAGASLAAKRERLTPAAFLSIAVAFMFTFSVAVAFVGGGTVQALRMPGDPAIAHDAGVAHVMGVRAFVRAYPSLLGDRFSSIHTMTHPPGRTIFAAALRDAWGKSSLGQALTLALFSSLVLIPLWFIARRLVGERAAGYAVVLHAVAPGPVLFAFASHETVETTIFMTAVALLLWGGVSGSGDGRLAFAGGVVLGLASFLTFAVVFIAAFAILLALMSRPLREAVRTLALAAAGGVAALVLLRVVFGYDLFGFYHASHLALRALPARWPTYYALTKRSYVYWLAGAPAAWLTFAGVSVAGLALRELFVERPRYLLALLVPVAVFYVLPSTMTLLIPGELERTVQYAYPLAAVAAATALVRWEAGDRARGARAIGWLVGIAAAQAILLEALYFTLF